MQKASDLVQSFYNQFNFRDDKGYGNLFSRWNEILGPNLASHCQPKDIKKGMLIVRVDHPGWHQECKLSEKRILADLSKYFPSLGIRRLAYVFEGLIVPPLPEVIVNVEAEVEDSSDSQESIELDLNDRLRNQDLAPELEASLNRLQAILKNNQKKGS